MKFINKIQELITILRKDLIACDIKWTLFVSAAYSYRYDSQLKPIPIQYLHGKTLDIEKLHKVIASVPPFVTFFGQLKNYVEQRNDTEAPNEATVDLIHWILVIVADPYFKTIEYSQVSKLDFILLSFSFVIIIIFVAFFPVLMLCVKRCLCCHNRKSA